MKSFVFIFLILPFFVFGQHKITGTFEPASEFKAAIIYKVETASTIYINYNNIVNGEFELTLTDSLQPGVYRLVYALPQEEFNFDFIYNNEDINFTFNQDQGVVFQNSEENKVLTAYREKMQDIKTKINAFYGNPNPNNEDYLKLISELKTEQNKFEVASKGMLAHHFITAEKPYMPTAFEDAPTYFNNYKSNFFKPIDFSDSVLQNSSFLIDSALNYVFIFVDKNHPNQSFKNNIDDVVKAMSDETVVKKTVLSILWTQFKDQQNEDLASYISTKYLTDLLDKTEDKDLLKEIQAFNNTKTGQVAPDFSWPTKTGQMQLSTLKNKSFYIVSFWSSTCSHCLEELPVLEAYIKDKQDMQVVAIGLEDQRPHWEQTITKFPDFTHVYGEGHWDNPIGITYGVTGTPSFFVLDTNKKIVAKPDDVEELITFLDLQN